MQRSSGERFAAAAADASGRAAEPALGNGGLLLRTLGRLELEPATISRPKPLLLLAYLALEGGGTREQLTALFFANSADPRDSLSTTLRRLGSVAGALEVVGQFVTTRIDCDAAAVLQLLDNGALAEACAAYDGPFLAGVAQPLPAAGEEWIFSVSEYLGKRILEAHLGLGELALQEADLTAARAHAAASFALHEQELLEPAVIDRLYHLLRRTGHPQADSVMDLVRDVVGVRTLDQAYDSQLPNLGPSRAGQIISRESELEAVVGAIIASEARLITIHGPGGIGKTRLAQELIRSPALAVTFGAARAFVPLEGVPAAELIPAAIATQLGLELPLANDQWAALADAIGSREQLLVLDGCEHLQGAGDHLVRLLPRCPGITVVVTSRETLRAPVEWVLSLGRLAVPSGSDPAVIRSAPAFRMFVQQARRHDLTFEVPDAAVGDAARVCHAVDGLPLALAMAGAWSRTMSLAEIAETLERDPTSLAADNADEEARHGSLKRVLDSAWSRLQPREREVMARLSVFVGGFRRDAAATVAGASLAELVSLLDHSWLTSKPDGRFEQHALLRHHARTRLEESPTASRAAHEAHNHHYLGWLMQAANGDAGSNAPDLLPRLLEEEGNMLAALERSIERRDVEALTVLAQSLPWFYAVRGRFRDADNLLASVLTKLPLDEPSLAEAVSLLFSGRAWCSRFVGDIDEALELARRALVFAELSGSLLARYGALDALGQGQMLVGDNLTATESFRTALAIARELADDGRACRIMEKLVYTNMAVGELTEATTISEAALKMVAEGVIKPSLDAVVSFMAAGFLAMAKRDWRGTAARMATGLELTQSIDHPGPATLLEAALGLGEVSSGLEDGDETMLRTGTKHATSALELARTRGEVLPMVFACSALARLAAHDGRFVDAQELLVEALAAAWAQGNRTAALWAFPWQVELYYLEGKLDAAAELAEALSRDPGTPAWIPEWLAELGALRGDANGAGPSLDELVERLLQL